MNAMLAGGWRFLRLVGAVERGLCTALMGWIVAAITIQIVTRYAFGQPLVWVEESSGYAFLWLVFLGASAGFKELRHIRIETFVGRLLHAPQQYVRATLYAICTVAMLVLAYYAWDLMDVESRSNTIALPIELPRHLFYSVPMFVSTISNALTGVYLVLAYCASAATGRPIEAEADVVERRLLDEELLNH